METIIKPDFPELNLEKIADTINVLRDQPAVEATEQCQRQEIYEFIMNDVNVTTRKLLEVADTLISNTGGQPIKFECEAGLGQRVAIERGPDSLFLVTRESLNPHSYDGDRIRILPGEGKVKIQERYTPWQECVRHPTADYFRKRKLRFVDIIPMFDKTARSYAFSAPDERMERRIRESFETYHMMPQFIVAAFSEGLPKRNEEEAEKIKKLNYKMKAVVGGDD